MYIIIRRIVSEEIIYQGEKVKEDWAFYMSPKTTGKRLRLQKASNI